ncbi:GGDEF domain-containing protein [Parasphingorhabdus halotolerans]|uniref:diguanylate cyclase n=1 Tax=Parasphingorhabdus halotolerans TaxID=2725558 RepID=A0A6H2DQQ0_9SPHN|nr:GGDEF domain-containing protein [Parasphingorhabdus halotolerans]QJB69996.1 GGDEF domain-containing protein [Parasphingorhabdus halotolerans]
MKLQISELEKMARHDVLTGLPNRRSFIEALETRIMRCQRYGDITALLYLDVNGLKSVNDAQGHTAGDQLLVHLGRLLDDNIRASDMVARIGGDEFALLLDKLDADQVEAKIKFLMERIASSTLHYDGSQIKMSAAIGYCFVGPKDSVEDLMVQADQAMYALKPGQS